MNFYFNSALNNVIGGLSPFTNYNCSARIQNRNSKNYTEQGGESAFQTMQGGQRKLSLTEYFQKTNLFK